MKMIFRAGTGLLFILTLSGTLSAQSARTAPVVQGEPKIELLDFKDTDIADVVRTISTGYNINVILDKDVSGKVTVRLANVPVMEGLETIVANLGLEVVKEGSVYRIRKQPPQQRTMIRFIRGKLTVDIQDMEVKDLLKELSSQAAVSIVPDAKISGKVTGKLYQVDLEDGLRALLEGNGFAVTKRKNIFYVGVPEAGVGPESVVRRARTGRAGGNLYVDYADGKVSLDVTDGKLEDVIKAIAEQSEMEIITYGKVNAEVNAKLVNAPLGEALALLLGGTGYTFIQRDNRILIGDRNPGTNSGQALSKSELVHLQHIKADEVPKVLPTDLVNKVKIVKEQNALLVTGTSEDIVKTREFLKTIDLSTPQVIVDALVVEYIRDTDRDFGLRFGRGRTAQTQMTWPDVQGSTTGQWLNSLFRQTKELQVLTKLNLAPNFFAELKLLETQQKAKILAQPSVTVLNGNKAEIDVGQTQYFKIVTGTTENQLYQFRPISFGINLKITPWISRSGQITAEINPVISNATGINREGYPNVFQRSVNTTVRFDNGETLVLGGLLRSDVLVTNDKVPILGDIPLLGMLFRATKKKNIQTNLVIFITPRIADGIVDISKELKRLDHEEKNDLFRDEKFSDILKSQSARKPSASPLETRRRSRSPTRAPRLFGPRSETAPVDTQHRDSVASERVAPSEAKPDSVVTANQMPGDTLSKEVSAPAAPTITIPVSH